MKKCLCFLLALCALVFCACAQKEETPLTTEEKGDGSPLFSIAGFDGKTENAVLIPLQKGFLFVAPTETGAFCGWVDPADSSLSEELFRIDGAAPSDFTVYQNEKDSAWIGVGEELWFALFSKGSAVKTDAPEGVSFSGGIYYDAGAFLTVKTPYILLVPTDLSKTYVLANTEKFDGFSALLTSCADRIYFAAGEPGAYTGIGAFDYGKADEVTVTPLAFSAFTRLAGGKVLLFDEPTGTYTLFDPANGNTKSFAPAEKYRRAVCNADFSLFIGTPESGARIDVIETASPETVLHYSLDGSDGAGGLALSPDGNTLLYSALFGENEILATLDLPRFLMKD